MWDLRVVGLLAALQLGSPIYAESPAEMLEKGIYHEEAVGNLSKAIKIYQQIVFDSRHARAVAAQAQYRLANCHLKQGDESAAVTAFRDLIENFAEQEALVAKARRHVPSEPTLLPAPWTDGECLSLTMSLAGGQKIGAVGTRVTAEELDGRPVWRMTTRRFITGGLNQGVSEVVVDRNSNRPISTNWDNTVLGTANATWSDTQLITNVIKEDGSVETKTHDLDRFVFSNDQVLFAMRQLPLQVGYKVTLPLRVAFTGGKAVDLEVEVPLKESLQTAAGDFECFRLDTNILQTYWVADHPSRYLVQFETEGVLVQLTSIDDGNEQKLQNDRLGFSVTVPGGWFHYITDSDNETTSAGFDLIAPTMAHAQIRVQIKDLLEPRERESSRAWLESRIKYAKQRFKDIAVRPGAIAETELAGVLGTRVILDHSVAGKPFVHEAAVAIKQSKAVEISVTALRGQGDRRHDQFEKMRKSVVVD